MGLLENSSGLLIKYCESLVLYICLCSILLFIPCAFFLRHFLLQLTVLDCCNVCNSVYSGFSFFVVFCSAMLLCLIVTMCLQLSLSWIFFWVFVVHSLRFQSKCVSNFFWSLNESWKWLFRTSLLTVDCMALSGGGWPTGWQEGRDEWPRLSFHSRTQHDFPIPSPLWMKTADVTERQLGMPMQCGITST
jgi:hypothetical protein